jgi:hypothetical protein
VPKTIRLPDSMYLGDPAGLGGATEAGRNFDPIRPAPLAPDGEVGLIIARCPTGPGFYANELILEEF